VKNVWKSVGIWQSQKQQYSGTLFPYTVYKLAVLYSAGKTAGGFRPNPVQPFGSATVLLVLQRTVTKNSTYWSLGEPFVKRFALCHRTVVCVSCNVGVFGQTVGWIKMPLGIHRGRPRPRRHVRWGPSSSTERGTTAPTFRPMSIVAKRSHISATAGLLSLFTFSTVRKGTKDSGRKTIGQKLQQWSILNEILCGVHSAWNITCHLRNAKNSIVI